MGGRSDAFVPAAFSEPVEFESYATLRELQAAEDEWLHLSKPSKQYGKAVQLTALLVLGLRRVRAEYAKRIEVWCLAARSKIEQEAEAIVPAIAQPVGAHPVVQPLGAPSALNRMVSWAASQRGSKCVREMRWLLPTLSVVGARLRQEGVVRDVSDNVLQQFCVSAGLPWKQDGQHTWGPQAVPWLRLRQLLTRRCVCPGEVKELECCWTCGGVRLPHWDGAPIRPCEWCCRPVTTQCEGCHCSIH